MAKAEKTAYGGAFYIGKSAEFFNCLFDSNAAIGGIDIDDNECCGNAYGGAGWASPQWYSSTASRWQGGKVTLKTVHLLITMLSPRKATGKYMELPSHLDGIMIKNSICLTRLFGEVGQ